MHSRPPFIHKIARPAPELPVIGSYVYAMQREYVPNGETVTIPARHQYLIYSSFEIEEGGTVDAQGALVIF